ncbi:MAG: hypothetical protein ACI35P_07975 [Bacillus sp. (in: firmicutes)]
MILLNKTQKMMAGVMASLMTVTVVGCGRPAEPTDTSCDDWDWDKETGTYYCDDYDSSSHGYYHYGGKNYRTKSALNQDSAYVTYKSGIGSGTKGSYGG